MISVLWCLAAVWISTGSCEPAESWRPDLEPGALRQFGTDTDLDNDVLPEERQIEELARIEQLKEMAAQRARLRQQQQQQEQQRQAQFSYSFPKAPSSSFALRPADPGYYAASIAADADSGEMQAGSDITLRQNSPLLQLDLDQLQAPAHLSLLQQAARLASLKQAEPLALPQQPLSPPLLKQPVPPSLVKQPVPASLPQQPQQQEEPAPQAEDEYQQQVEAAQLADSQQLQQDVRTSKLPSPDDGSDLYFIAIVAGCSAAAIVGIIAIGISWYRLQKNAKAAADVEYPAYGVTGPNKEASPTGDRRLAQSAQMYHYQHQKQQIIAMESRTGANERPGSVSEAESDEEGEEGDYTVYECPGLAPTGEMEVKNPLFQDEPTPATPAPKAPTAPEKADQPPAQPLQQQKQQP